MTFCSWFVPMDVSEFELGDDHHVVQRRAVIRGVRDRVGRAVSEHALIDQALDRLRGPTSVQDRLGILQELIQFWHGPIQPGDGIADGGLAGIAMPEPLRSWYRWAGKRRDIMLLLMKPKKLEIEDGLLRFNLDDQEDAYQWGTFPEGDDPPVFGRFDAGELWEAENVRISEHLILMCVDEVIAFHAKHFASAAGLEERKLAEIASIIPPLAIGPWGWSGKRFFAGTGAFMVACASGPPEGEQRYFVSIGAKTREPLQFLRTSLDEHWYRVRI